MSDNPLKMIPSDSNKNDTVKHGYTGKASYKQEMQAKFERLWLRDPKRFDPERSSIERERTRRIWNLITKHIDLKGKRVVDLGCGAGYFSRKLRDAGAKVDAVDISSNALKEFHKQGAEDIKVTQGYVPHTLLNDDEYDLVLASDLVAHIHKNEHRLFMAELARLVKSDGYVVCSTPLDFHSESPLERFAGLAETEFDVIEWVVSHNSWYITISDFFEAPRRFVKASTDLEYRNSKLSERVAFSKWWFKVNSTPLCGSIWKILGLPFRPFAHLLRESNSLLLMKEKAARFLAEDSAVSYAIFIAKRRPMVKHVPENEIPKIHPGKKQVWE